MKQQPGQTRQADSAANITVLGFDYGEQRIGIAVAQTLTARASAVTTLHSKQSRPNWQAITTLIDEWQPGALVVGHPLHLDGTTQPITAAADKFARQLTGRYHLPVYLVDERLTSAAAESELRERGIRYQKEEIDMHAARLILQDWLNQQQAQQQ